jgi:hypothetical protein
MMTGSEKRSHHADPRKGETASGPEEYDQAVERPDAALRGRDLAHFWEEDTYRVGTR